MPFVVNAFDVTTRNTPEQKEIRAAYTSRFFQALIKIYTPCNLPNLFSCQISSSPAFTGCPPRRVWVLPPRGVQPRGHPTQCSAANDSDSPRNQFAAVAFDAQHQAGSPSLFIIHYFNYSIIHYSFLSSRLSSRPTLLPFPRGK